jgi:hypothetical protein
MARIGPWAEGNCHNYYRAPGGRIVTQWPHSMSEYRRRTEVDDTAAFETSASETSASETSAIETA